MSSTTSTPIRRTLCSINPAESVFFPFFDFGLLKLTALDITSAPGVSFNEEQETMISWSTRSKDQLIFSVSGSFDTDISHFDQVFLHGAFPVGLQVQLTLTMDDVSTLVLDKHIQTAGEQEFSETIRGRHFSQASLRLISTQDGSDPVTGRLLMAGFADTAARASLYEPAFPEDWHGAVKPADEPLDFKPGYGLWFDENELEIIRQRARTADYQPLMEQLRADARACMAETVPERMVWTKETRALVQHDMFQRPHEAHFWRGLQHPARVCALVGLLDKNHEMLRHAARCAMAMVARPDWSWGYHRVAGTRWFGVPGQNAQMLQSIIETLDWAGSALTRRGREKCWDAAMRQGVGHTLNCMSRVDWLYQHNHGMHGAVVLCMAGLALARDNQHGKWLLETAERMFQQTSTEAFLNDGSTVEGPGYWGNVVAQCGIILALARYHKCTPQDYIKAKKLPEGLLLTNHYFSTFIVNDPTATPGSYLPINDSGWGLPPACRPEALAVAAALSGNSDMLALHTRRLQKINARFEAFSMGPHLLLLVPPHDNKTPIYSSVFNILPKQGSLTCRRASALGNVRINLLGWQGQPIGHTQEDKGSIILEIGGECLLIDPGITIYGDPRTPLLQQASHHNLLIPLGPDNQPLHQNARCQQPILVQGALEDGVLSASVDLTPAWAGQCQRNIRQLRSPHPLLWTIQDEIQFEAPQAAGLYFQSLFPIQQSGKTWIIQGTNAKLLITPNWQLASTQIDVDTINHFQQPVYRLCLRTPLATTHTLTTTLQLEPPHQTVLQSATSHPPCVA